MAIQHHDTSTRGYFTMEEDGVEKGKLHYSWAGLETVIVNHTEVYPQFENQGYGLKLVEASVEFARSRNVKIIPKCSFTKVMFKEHSEWKDVLFQV
jgi:predicted GNAT family acetyltransferase